MPDKSSSKKSLLDCISAFCQQTKMAESTFGRLSVNDGKFVSRLRDGARVTPETWSRVNKFIADHGGETMSEIDPASLHLISAGSSSQYEAQLQVVNEHDVSSNKNFRFFDNRQKYLLFVNTCGEKEIIAKRVGMELANVRPNPPALRIFDAGMGDGSVITRVMRETHRRFPTIPLYIASKEISLEDVRLSLSRMSDRFFEHPSTVLVLTNMYYSEAPRMSPRKVEAAKTMVWKDVALSGTSAHEFDEQLGDLDGFLTRNWQASHSPKTGNPVYERPVVLVIYREDYRFLLNDVIPRQGKVRADYDLVIASQPYRLRVSDEFKAQKVLSPLVRSLGRGGRLLGIHSYGNDPGLEIIKEVWPEEDPYKSNRHDLLRALKSELGKESRNYNFNVYADVRSIFRYDMHTLPSEVSSSIGTSTLFAAWNSAVYVAQMEDARLTEAITDDRYLLATDKILKKYGGLWLTMNPMWCREKRIRKKTY